MTVLQEHCGRLDLSRVWSGVYVSTAGACASVWPACSQRVSCIIRVGCAWRTGLGVRRARRGVCSDALFSGSFLFAGVMALSKGSDDYSVIWLYRCTCVQRDILTFCVSVMALCCVLLWLVSSAFEHPADIVSMSNTCANGHTMQM